MLGTIEGFHTTVRTMGGIEIGGRKEGGTMAMKEFDETRDV